MATLSVLIPPSQGSSPLSQYYSVVPSPASGGSTSSSIASWTAEDEENITITANHSLLSSKNGKRKSQEDIRLLAISTRITELSYSISDIQTRIFEIQELRHKTQSTGDTSGTTNVIDKSLMSLDARLEEVSEGMKSVKESLKHYSNATDTSKGLKSFESTEQAIILRKHTTLSADWEAVQDESEVLREELKEDKWLTVFRTVTEQADGMMSSLEKAVNRCQDFIWQVHRKGNDDPVTQSSFAKSLPVEKSQVSLEVFNSLVESFEAKKKHYMPATSKVLSIIDKGVQDRVTKNGETLRRHAESAKRWRSLKDTIARTEVEMEKVRKILLGGDLTPSENGSSTSGATHNTRNGYLATPPSGSKGLKSRAPSRATSSAASTISRSMSPLRKFARRITGVRTPVNPATPLPVSRESSREPSSEPARSLRRQRTSIFGFRGTQAMQLTPERGHKHSHSLTPESSPSKHADINSTVKLKTLKQPWNSSTRVEPEDRSSTIKISQARRPTPVGLLGQSENLPPLIPPTPSRRSVSRSSMASSRPWSPVASSISTAPSSNPSIPPMLPLSVPRPPSRSQTPGLGTTPRPRAKTPSHIPAPALHWRSISARPATDDDDEDYTTLMQRAFSPTLSTSGPSRSQTPCGSIIPPPRPPSRSMIPVPSFQISSASRPSSTMSFYRSESPSMSSFLQNSNRAQTPESAMRAKTQQITSYQGSGSRSARPSPNKLPPSSFRDGSNPRAPSRPGSRAGASTPSLDQNPIHLYVPANTKDPLDTEVASIVNSIAHGLLIERIDPPLRTVPREGEEIRAQYAFSNSLSRKIVTCRLTTLTRSGPKSAGHDATTKKVMCRVGGGWQDLHLYMLNRQAGL